MRGSRLVEIEIRVERARYHLLREQMVEHEHVGLLQHLCDGRALGAEQEVGGDRPSWSYLFDDERLSSKNPLNCS